MNWPADIKALDEGLEALERETQTVAEGLTEATGGWRPREGCVERRGVFRSSRDVQPRLSRGDARGRGARASGGPHAARSGHAGALRRDVRALAGTAAEPLLEAESAAQDPPAHRSPALRRARRVRRHAARCPRIPARARRSRSRRRQVREPVHSRRPLQPRDRPPRHRRPREAPPVAGAERARAGRTRGGSELRRPCAISD